MPKKEKFDPKHEKLKIIQYIQLGELPPIAYVDFLKTPRRKTFEDEAAAPAQEGENG